MSAFSRAQSFNFLISFSFVVFFGGGGIEPLAMPLHLLFLRAHLIQYVFWSRLAHSDLGETQSFSLYSPILNSR